MDSKIIIFSGMPASGKDTITELLCKRSDQYTAIKKYRSVQPDTPLKDTYYNVSVEQFEEKIAHGDFLQYHKRYGRYYGIGKEELCEILAEGLIPIIHIGRIENYYVFMNSIEELLKYGKLSCKVIHILLWETMDILLERIRIRDQKPDEMEKRFIAAEEELYDNSQLMKKGKNPYTLIIRNSDSGQSCDLIEKLVRSQDNPCAQDMISKLTEDGYQEFISYVRNYQFK